MRSLFLITPSALRLSRREQLEAARASFWLAAARVGLTLLSYQRIAQLITTIPARRSRTRTSPERCARAVRRASRLVPGSGCLPRAVATQCLLQREGLTSRIVFGVAQDEDGGLRAHAWLWNDGRILIGGEIADRYTPLTAPRAS